MAINVATVFIVDDQPAFRLGLRSILEQAEDVSVLGECSLSEKAVELVGRSQPRLALVGTTPLLHLGLDICRRIGQRSPGDHVIVMTH